MIALNLILLVSIQICERCEDELDLFFSHTYSLIFNRHFQVEFVFLGVCQLGTYADGAFSRELAGIAYEVENDLLEPPPIQAENRYPGLVKVDLNLSMGLVESDYLDHL